MKNIYDSKQQAFGHKNLFGETIDQKEMIQYIAEYSASQWLELFAKIEGFLFVKLTDVLNPQVFLAERLLPESTLRKVGNLKCPVEEIKIFTPASLNILRKLAIVYGKGDSETITIIPRTIISRVILAAQDFNNEYDVSTNINGDFGSFCQFVIRNGYLNKNPDFVNLFIRAYRMYILEAKNISFYKDKSFADFFNENVCMSIEKAMALNFTLASPFFQEKEKLLNQTTIIDPTTFFRNLDIELGMLNAIIESLVIDLPKLKDIYLKELATSGLGQMPIGYNLDVFRKTPLIRLESGKLVCANLSCLLEKTTQNIIWMPKSRTSGLSQEESDRLVNKLTDYRGVLFEEYIRGICNTMEDKNKKISSHYIPPEFTGDNEEVGDSLLIQDGNIVIIEAKSRQFKEEFKYTGDWTNDSLFIKELIEKAAKQIGTASNKIRQDKIKDIPLKSADIKKIYPIVVTYEIVPVHTKVQRFIRNHVKELNYLKEDIFAPLEIIDINTLEKVMDIMDSCTLIELLQEKNRSGPHASETCLKNFLCEYTRLHKLISNGWQADQFEEFKKEVFEPNLKFKE